MEHELNDLINRYSTWLRKETSVRQIDNRVEITTPFLDRHNDFIQIFAEIENGCLILTDDGYVLNDLELSGFNLETPSRLALLEISLNRFDVTYENKRLLVEISESDFAIQKLNLIQAMLAIGDLAYLDSDKPLKTDLFFTKVENWFNRTNIRFTPNHMITGKSGFIHRFDFVIPKSQLKPERLIHVVKRPNLSVARNIVFSWLDTEQSRSPDTLAYALFDDSDHWSENADRNLAKNRISTIPWSERDTSVSELVA